MKVIDVSLYMLRIAHVKWGLNESRVHRFEELYRRKKALLAFDKRYRILASHDGVLHISVLKRDYAMR